MARHQRFVGPVIDTIVTGPRPGRMRDRRGRGLRGPAALPGPLSPDSIPAHQSPREAFDLLVSEIVRVLEPKFEAETEPVDIVVEEAPLLPREWDEPVPTSVVAYHHRPTRLVLYRLPLTQGAGTHTELAVTVWSSVLEGLAQVWHVPPESLDPRSH